MKSILNLEMANYVSPEIVVDAFQAKLGRDEDVSVIQFQSTNKDVANDLVQFIESGHDYILDADYSPAKNDQKKYNVFVEIARDEELPNKIMKLVRDAEQVTGLLPWKFRFHKEDQFYHLDEVNLNRVIPTTADQYKFLTDDKVSDDINQLFQESRATVKRTGKELTMKTLYNKHTFIIEAVNVPNKDINGIFRIDESSSSQAQYLVNWLGDMYNIVKLDDVFKISKEDKNILLRSEEL